jgi:NADPH:quinone reductase-like Zn-dependent oxidoreductase
VPKLQPNEVLIKVAYAALNPADQKGIDMISPPGAIIGSDLSGTIVALGSDVNNPELAIGTRVATLVTGAKYPDQGSFAEYCKAESELVWIVPDGLRLEEAAAYPMALITNGQVSSHTDDASL